jgi:hypothetical protein
MWSILPYFFEASFTSRCTHELKCGHAKQIASNPISNAAMLP